MMKGKLTVEGIIDLSERMIYEIDLPNSRRKTERDLRNAYEQGYKEALEDLHDYLTDKST